MRVLTLGHGTLSADDLGDLLRGAAVRCVVDVRRYPGSRRHPQFARAALERWLPALRITYRWDEALGGRRAPRPDSPHGGLRNSSFRGYADHMASPEGFAAGVARLLDDAARSQTAVLCSESLWWRCHRRLLADHLVLVAGVAVDHVLHDGSLIAHVLTDAARRDGVRVRYPATTQPVLPLS